MKITIDYESSWRNSFLDGNNNEPLPPRGRKFIASMKNLKKSENFIKRGITHSTVMGVLNRLIGDQRKLYQTRQDEKYYFRDLENNIEFDDSPTVVNEEFTYIRNITGSTDQNSYTGMIKGDDPIFQSEYSREFWGILALDLSQLYSYIISDVPVITTFPCNPLAIISRLEEINSLKPIENVGVQEQAFNVMRELFVKYNGQNKKGMLLPISLYCSSLYMQLNRLSRQYDVSSAKAAAGGISGISNNGFTKKDFMNRYTTGEKKKIWGNPYIHEEFIKGEGRTKHLMTKASGELVITLDIEKGKARELASMIDCAGVSSFYLGKKGLAYVSEIRV